MQFSLSLTSTIPHTQHEPSRWNLQTIWLAETRTEKALSVLDSICFCSLFCFSFSTACSGPRNIWLWEEEKQPGAVSSSCEFSLSCCLTLPSHTLPQSATTVPPFQEKTPDRQDELFISTSAKFFSQRFPHSQPLVFIHLQLSLIRLFPLSYDLKVMESSYSPCVLCWVIVTLFLHLSLSFSLGTRTKLESVMVLRLMKVLLLNYKAGLKMTPVNEDKWCRVFVAAVNTFRSWHF